jgi:hypothetical protein
MRTGGRDDHDRITCAQHATLQHYRHDAGFADQPARFIAPEHCRHQPWLEMIKLGAGIAEPSDFHDRFHRDEDDAPRTAGPLPYQNEVSEPHARPRSRGVECAGVGAAEGAATDAPANPNTPGTTRQDRDSGAFARAGAERASASILDRQGRMVFFCYQISSTVGDQRECDHHGNH